MEASTTEPSGIVAKFIMLRAPGPSFASVVTAPNSHRTFGTPYQPGAVLIAPRAPTVSVPFPVFFTDTPASAHCAVDRAKHRGFMESGQRNVVEYPFNGVVDWHLLNMAHLPSEALKLKAVQRGQPPVKLPELGFLLPRHTA